MKRNMVYRLAAAALAGALALGLTACGEEKTVSSSAASAPVSSAAEATPTPEPTPEPTPKPTPTPAPTATPTPEPESSLPVGDFDTEFEENPIDQQYQESLSLATSYTIMQQACDQAAANWKRMIDVAYDTAQRALSGEDLEQVQAEQEQWEAELDGKVDALRALSGDSPDSAITTAQEIVGLYRQRARELCQACYQVTGQMPDFEAALSQGEPVG